MINMMITLDLVCEMCSNKWILISASVKLARHLENSVDSEFIWNSYYL